MNVRTLLTRRTLVPVFALATSACATTTVPTSYYSLMPEASSAAAAPSDNSYQIEVLPVEVPMQVDVAQMVVRTGKGELVPVDTRRWIAPLPNELRNALSWQLTRTLGVRDVAGLGRSAATPVYRISLRVQRFDSAPGAYARIDASWSIRSSDSDSSMPVCNSNASISVPPGYAELAQGHQQALAQIAAEIASTIRNARNSKQALACPAKSG